MHSLRIGGRKCVQARPALGTLSRASQINDHLQHLARIFHQAAYSFSESSLFSFNFITTLGGCGGNTVRWPRSRLSFAPVRVHARCTIGRAMLPLPSTRTGAKSGAIFAALGEICGLVVRKIVSACPTPHDLACSPSALERYGKPEIFNTDQGNPFTGRNRTDMLKASGIQISMDGEDRWLDNVLIERLWRSLERECVPQCLRLGARPPSRHRRVDGLLRPRTNALEPRRSDPRLGECCHHPVWYAVHLCGLTQRLRTRQSNLGDPHA